MGLKQRSRRYSGCLVAAVLPFLPAGAIASGQQTTSYAYDAKGRLTGVTTTGCAGEATTRYRHDAADNRQQVTTFLAAPVMPNGDFEASGFNGFAYTPSVACLSFTGKAGIAVNGSAWGFPSPWSGSRVAFLQSSDNVTGAIEIGAVNLVIGKRYQIAFAAARRPGFPENNIRILIDGQLVWNGSPASSDHFSAYPTPSFIARQTRAVVRFESSPTSYDSASAIDAVSVQQLD